MRTVVAEERRQSLFTNAVRRSVDELNAATSPDFRSGSSVRGGAGTVRYYSSTSTQSSVFMGSNGDADDEFIEAIEVEGVKMAQSLQEITDSLENIKSYIGARFEA